MTRQGPSRREFLSSTGALVAGALTANEAGACLPLFRRRTYCVPAPGPGISMPQLRVRRDIASLNTQQLNAFKQGVAAMKMLPANDTSSWAFQANIHGMMGPATNPLFKQCEHGTLHFLTWHRGYLYFFERILRKMSGYSELTLPYWNWRAAPSLPAAFRLPADATNTLFEGSRSINDGSALPPAVVVTSVNNALNTVPFGPVPGMSFSSRLESPHGIIHGMVGGIMGGVATSANDPIFWLHHGNIDRLWDYWLTLGGGRLNPSDTAFLDKTYSFADENGATVAMKVRDMLTSAQLGYRYDNVPNPAAMAYQTRGSRQFEVLGQPVEKAKPEPQIVATSAKGERGVPQPLEAVQSKPLGFKPERVKLDLLPDRAPALRTAVEAAAKGREGKVLLEIQGISFAEVPNFTYGVYLNLPEDETDPRRIQQHYVGAVNFFGRGEGHGHDGAKPFTETFDASGTVARLQQARRWNPEALTVTLRPLTVIPPRGQEDELKKRSEDSATKAKMSYKRVDLVVP